MWNRKLNDEVLRYFIQYLIGDKNAFCCKRLRRLSFASNRVAEVAKNTVNFDLVFFSNNGPGVSVGSKFERTYIDDLNVLRINFLGFHRLISPSKNLRVVLWIIANMPDEDELEFFTPEASEECGKLLISLFPNARFYIDFDCEGNPTASMRILPFIHELPWFAGYQFDRLEIRRKRRREGFCGISAKLIFPVKAKKIICEEQFNLDFLLGIDSSEPSVLEELCGNIEFNEVETPDLYLSIFKTVSKSLPNLRQLTLTYCDTTVRWRDPQCRRAYEHDMHFGFEDNQMSELYKKAVHRLAWHIIQHIKHSHVNTKISIQFPVRNDDYCTAVQHLFCKLLSDFSVNKNGISEFDYPGSRKTLLFKEHRTEIAVVVEVLR